MVEPIKHHDIREDSVVRSARQPGGDYREPEGSEFDITEQKRPWRSEDQPAPANRVEIPAGTSEADALDQSGSWNDESLTDMPSPPLEVSEADFLDQNRVVPLDEEDLGDGSSI